MRRAALTSYIGLCRTTPVGGATSTAALSVGTLRIHGGGRIFGASLVEPSQKDEPVKFYQLSGYSRLQRPMIKDGKDLATDSRGTTRGMTLKRVILGILTAIAIALVGLSLVASWNQPQIQSRLELYQTNLLLHASEWQGENNQSANLSSARNNIVGADPLNTALTQYQEARQSTRKTLETTQAQFKAIQSAIASKPDDNTLNLAQDKALSESIEQQSALLNELDLRLGILQASSGKTQAAIQTWKNLVERYNTQIDYDPSAVTAKVLTGIWSNRLNCCRMPSRAFKSLWMAGFAIAL